MKKVTKADVQLLSRAFNLARGMVSPSYLKAEKEAKSIKKIEPMKKAKGGKVKK